MHWNRGHYDICVTMVNPWRRIKPAHGTTMRQIVLTLAQITEQHFGWHARKQRSTTEMNITQLPANFETIEPQHAWPTA
jgi:hypothetical protein